MALMLAKVVMVAASCLMVSDRSVCITSAVKNRLWGNEGSCLLQCLIEIGKGEVSSM